ncbi:hypothetical protein MML48_1g19120 [Holotrichia oblita]|uniref:Uncharacterized protein n=1 Tax=Holotrichia oblita TaxID=644536 RepID=A0ACB9TXR2_HOLOL|nr:hypothetical protein MML48_1g19120 [Holotrichia oblita]
MLKVEEKYHERIETKSPMRVQAHQEFDNNLDYLLEDLQNSITRSEPSIDYRRQRQTSPTRVTSLRPANQIIEYADDSYSRMPTDGAKNVKTVKKEMYYQSSSSGGGIPHESSRIRNNINELDSLLDDLQQVKQSPDSYKSTSGGQNYREYSKSKVISGKTVVENVYPDTSISKNYVSSGTGPDEIITTDSQFLNEGNCVKALVVDCKRIDGKSLSLTGTYGNIKTRSSATPPPPPPPGKSNTLTRQTKITNVHSYPIEVIETTTPEMNQDILASLDPNLLPTGNTKVTTTIKTYTYEIPGTVYPGTSPNTTVDSKEKFVYSPNDSQTTPSKSFVYNKYEDNTVSNVNYISDQPQYRPQPPPPQPPVIVDDRRIITETVTTSKNYQGGPPAVPYPDTYGKPTHHYKESTLTRSTGTNTSPYDRPPQSPTLPDNRAVSKETIISRNYQPGNTYVDTSGQHTYIYNESTLTRTTGTNTESPVLGRDSPSYPNRHPPYTGSKPSPTPNRGGGPPYDQSVVNITTSTTNYIDDSRNKPPPSQYSLYYSERYKAESNYDENKPLLKPYPNRFPTDNDSPPKKLDELMATIGAEPPNSPLNAGFNAHEIELAQQKKVETLKMQQKEVDKDEQKKLQHTKNVTGPPVYYPPGHDMFITKTESSGGGWRAEGAMAKESGKYKYEAESKSTTKTKAAIVPVCLPLCCGLPCTIL